MMLCCRASPNDFKAALSWSLAALSIWRTNAGARAVPAGSSSLGRGGLENFRVFTPAMLLRTGTVRGPAVAASKCAPKESPLLHRMEERAGERTDVGFSSPRSSPHSYIVGRG